ncbi:hypothetical protein ISF_04717 [Cordyceps fumosorosea ARSEF 2679]|uniref:Uncharacterized protein n=1 Tax=Cordyceps fumosorosea (strain ARSEF 2679) TaxID=1081104 RepID=A0A167WNF1_CORFA|nr:hypothetical protein ISF_04717 [Cordyceps fumosorosea ARSEF 2679]OAA64008.1 hypothetical protein ISF_04717 [Cordyceps fumosorosea ARSEF 2679]
MNESFFAHMGGLGSNDMRPPYQLQFPHSTVDDDDVESNDSPVSDTTSHPYETGSSQGDTFSDRSSDTNYGNLFANGTAVGYFPSIELTENGDIRENGPEDERRSVFLPSVSGDSSDASSATHESGFSKRRGERHPDRDCIFSSDGKTRASRTTAQSIAQQAMNAQLLNPIQELPEVFSDEPVAPGDIAHPGHWNHAGVTQMTHGLQASSASAMAALASSGASSAALSNTSTRRTDATEVVAYLPCEFQKYENCTATFPLHRSEFGIDAWTDHMVRMHMAQRFPSRNSQCWFCDIQFPINKDCQSDRSIVISVYRKRMRHIAQHYLKQARGEEARAEPRRDPDFEAHLVENGIWVAPAVEGGKARVPSGNDVRAPIQDRCLPTKRFRSTQSEVEVITERRRHSRGGRSESHQQVRHHQ